MTKKSNKIKDLCVFLDQNPGRTETDILYEHFGFSRAIHPNNSNKKFADMIRRGMTNGYIYREYRKIPREHLDERLLSRYVYFAAENWKEQMSFMKATAKQKAINTRELNKRMCRSEARAIFHQKLFNFVQELYKNNPSKSGRIYLSNIKKMLKNMSYSNVNWYVPYSFEVTMTGKDFDELCNSYKDFLKAHYKTSIPRGWNFWDYDRLQKHLRSIEKYNPDILKVNSRFLSGHLYIEIKTDKSIILSEMAKWCPKNDQNIDPPRKDSKQINFSSIEQEPWYNEGVNSLLGRLGLKDIYGVKGLFEQMGLVDTTTELPPEENKADYEKMQMYIYNNWLNANQMWELVSRGDQTLDQFHHERQHVVFAEKFKQSL